MSPSLLIRKLERNSDEGAVVDLHNRLYPHKPIGVDYVQHRYLDHAFCPVAFVAEVAGRFVGSYAGCIFPAGAGDQSLKAGFLFDAMIDPAFQSRGIIVPLYRTVASALMSMDASFLYSSANVHATSLYTGALGWRLVRTIRLLVAPTVSIRLRERPANRHSSMSVGSIVPGDHDVIATHYRRSSHGVYIRHDPAFARWRLTSLQGRTYRFIRQFGTHGQLCGLACCKLFETAGQPICGDVLEVFAHTREDARHTLAAAIRHLADVGAEHIGTWGLAGLDASELLALGFTASGPASHLIVQGLPEDGAGREFWVNMLDAEMF